MLLLLACTKPDVEPIDSDPVVEDTGCDVGVGVGDCPADFALIDQTGVEYVFSEHDPVVVSVSVMWDPTWQDRVREVDDFYEAHPEIATFDVLVENLAGEDPLGSDALLWSDSLGLSLTVLLADDDFRESWADPGENGSYVVFVRGGVVTLKATSATADVQSALEGEL